MKRLILTLLCLALPAYAAERANTSDIVILGEVHDNPAHHATQADWAARLGPSAIVFEMLTPEQAAQVTPENRDDAAALASALEWSESGWPDFAMYHPIFTSAPEARVYGAAVPRDVARAAFADGVVTSFGTDAAEYGLADPLPEAQMQERLAFQARAHCDALPEHMLPQMVELQRLRDAVLARTTVQALEDTGGPVVVITGNGHARTDWGMPVYIAAARPELRVFALGQSEAGSIAGTFDQVVDAAPVERDDPCAVFAKD